MRQGRPDEKGKIPAITLPEMLTVTLQPPSAIAVFTRNGATSTIPVPEGKKNKGLDPDGRHAVRSDAAQFLQACNQRDAIPGNAGAGSGPEACKHHDTA